MALPRASYPSLRRLAAVGRLAWVLTLTTRSHAFAAHGASVPPTTLLGGFLGAGKTTTLEHMLTNRDGLRIAVLVNDVAAVNVDAATVRRTSAAHDGVEMVELENGCVCCGPGSGELAPAVAALLRRTDAAGESAFDHVVVELSGVADPTTVEANLQAGGVAVAHKLALVDANAFPSQYNSVQQLGERTDLAGAAAAAADPCAIDRRVVELLLLQVETADAILVNKCDLASDDELRTTLAACRALNGRATIVPTTYGGAQLDVLLPRAAPAAPAPHAHEHSHAAAPHAHEHSHAAAPHAHEHSHGGVPCDGGAHCAEETHSHSHGGVPCDDPRCAPPAATSTEALGFVSFVYRARRPFVQHRLAALVRRWPLPLKQTLSFDSLAAPGAAALAGADGAKDDTFARVLRSKGRAWLDSSHRVVATWSHAGRHFLLTPGGAWWASLPVPVMRSCLAGSPADGASAPVTAAYEAERAAFEGPMGDRRQEIVFIGTELDEAKITAALDSCLASDKEMAEYELAWAVEEERIAASAGPFRFEKGASVECCLGPNMWERGVVVGHYYREAAWPTDRWMPYQVQLESGELIYAPADVEDCIRSAE
ncbi:hypothetical protein AB1Y20_021510 [Prymnesium parvum]|uniref:CobW C-terminal domain-containing protein n=1 Tax=Prymnesium parvum TaxID=97485 RepID=A0AB34JMG4_PRYPA